MGEVSALLAALVWAAAIVLFRRSEAVDSQGLNLFKNVVALGLLAVTLPLLGVPIDTGRSAEDWVRIVVSGVLGLALADVLVFMALRRLGAGLLATVDTTYAPTIVLLSVFILNEPMTAGLIAGGALVVVGVLVATRDKHRYLPEGKNLRTGVAAGLLGTLLMALSVIVVKPVLEKGSLLEITFLRLVAGIVGQLLWLTVVRRGRTALAAFRPSTAWKTLVPASILGSYVGMLLWLAGFKWANASIAAVLNQMSVVFIIVLSRIFLKEPVSTKRAAGAAIAIVGACVVLLL